ncbi:hypothetical protein J3L16_04735 [Alteromonas sp. 5E99-2]|uniref:hypothetical protein n=1 Tax=Alteromonas sp. 5E99-2 TaxID=2817683 RepID=UPI001A9903DB|nr:hypothetical protein [Alteromonas sp. 5E99-2]MBO1254993.1 hypothetical protein [Alteromonas sp. 5E99-2]
MNYSDWLIHSYPELKDKSSAQIYQIITQAKGTTRTVTLCINVLLYSISVASVFYLILPALGLEPFSNLASWGLYVVVLVFINLISNFLEKRTVKNALSKLMADG